MRAKCGSQSRGCRGEDECGNLNGISVGMSNALRLIRLGIKVYPYVSIRIHWHATEYYPF